MSTTGKIVGLCIRPGRRQTPEERPSLTIAPGTGVVDDHGTSEKRQITIMAQEAWNDAAGLVDGDPSWTTRRANVLVEGVDLESLLLGGRLTLGECEISIVGETFPCDQMDEACDGLKNALLPETRGGVYGRIENAGTISVGDVAAVKAPGKKKQLP